jgi:hypothetical protein
VRGKDGRGWLPIHGCLHLGVCSGEKQILVMESMAEAVVTEPAAPIAAIEDAY